MKSKSTAILICLILGGIGGHQFYLGNNMRGLLYLFFCWSGIPLVFALFDLLNLVFTRQEVFQKKYNGKWL